MIILIPADNVGRVRLRPTGVTGADYINASFIDVSSLSKRGPLFSGLVVLKNEMIAG